MIRGRRRREVAGEDRRQSVRMDDAPRAARSMGQAEDRVAFARPEIVAVRTPDDAAVSRVDREELVGPDALLVDAARGEQKASVVRRSADAATGSRDPTAPVEVAEQLDEELTRRLLVGRRGMQRHVAECRGRAGHRISQRSREYIAGAMTFANVFVR